MNDDSSDVIILMLFFQSFLPLGMSGNGYAFSDILLVTFLFNVYLVFFIFLSHLLF